MLLGPVPSQIVVLAQQPPEEALRPPLRHRLPWVLPAPPVLSIHCAPLSRHRLLLHERRGGCQHV